MNERPAGEATERSWFACHDGEVFAVAIVGFVAAAHLLAKFELAVVAPEAALTGIVGTVHCLLRSERDRYFRLGTPIARTSTSLVMLFVLGSVIMYMLTLGVVAELDGVRGNMIAVGSTALIFPIALAGPYKISSGRFAEAETTEPVKELG